MEAAEARPPLPLEARLSPTARLSPRCLMNTSSPSMGSLSSSTLTSSRSPFGLSRQPSVSSSIQSPSGTLLTGNAASNAIGLPATSIFHGRQGSVHSSTSNEVGQYLHSRTSSNLSTGNGGAKSPPLPLPPRRPPLVTSLKLSPTSLDMGYHTMGTNGGHDFEGESPPFLVPPPPPPPSRPAMTSLDTTKQIVIFKQQANTVCHFDKLSDDLVLKILSHLSTNSLCICARISRRFYFLAWEPRLWSSISLSSVKKGNKALSTLLQLLSRDSTCKNVLKLSLNNLGNLEDDGLELVAASCPNLRSVEVKNCREITNLAVQSLVTKCSSITHLDLSGK